jgi:predicted dehydrogenase
MELLGAEYSMTYDSLSSGLSIFLSRRVAGAEGEDLIEKQNAEQGLMPVIADEAGAYGYVNEDRHMVNAFLSGHQPDEDWEDGVAVMEVLMACYMSAEQGSVVRFPEPALERFTPAVATGTWHG